MTPSTGLNPHLSLIQNPILLLRLYVSLLLRHVALQGLHVSLLLTSISLLQLHISVLLPIISLRPLHTRRALLLAVHTLSIVDCGTCAAGFLAVVVDVFEVELYVCVSIV